MDEHRHDFVDHKCVICGSEQWRCLTCGHWLVEGEHCYLPWCVENRIRAARSMGCYELPKDDAMPDSTGTP